MTFVNGTALTAAQLNTHLRDNMRETFPAIASATASYGAQVCQTRGRNKLVTYGINSVENTGTIQIRSSNYTEAVGPSLSMLTNKSALCIWAASLDSTVNDAATYCSIAVSGATDIDFNDIWSSQRDGAPLGNEVRFSMIKMFYNELNPGINTFTMGFRINNSQGSARRRELIVWGL